MSEETAAKTPTTFEICGKEYVVHVPRGRSGRKATAFLLKKMGMGGEANAEAVFDLLTEDSFLDEHLPGFLGVSKEVIEEADIMELLTAVMSTLNSLTLKMALPEVDAALKNSTATAGGQQAE